MNLLSLGLTAFLPGGKHGRVAELLKPSRPVEDIHRSLKVDDATRNFLLFCAVPTWQAAGLADWYCHRRTEIEKTAGARESVMHSLMMVEAGIPALMGLFLEVNAGVLLAVLAGLGAHEATVAWDVSYAETRRRVTPTEQHVHSFLEVGPVMAAAFLAVLHWDQAAALVGLGGKRPGFALRLKRRPLSFGSLAGLLVSLGLCVGLPYGEEMLRCLRTRPTLAAQPQPVEPATRTLRIAG